jgi:hypothetical protein
MQNLMKASKDPKMLAEAMEMLKDPETAAEVCIFCLNIYMNFNRWACMYVCVYIIVNEYVYVCMNINIYSMYIYVYGDAQRPRDCCRGLLVCINIYLYL